MIHQLFTPARPALAPILFPLDSMDTLLADRQETIRLAIYCVKKTDHPYRMAAGYLAWAQRIDAKIAQVVS